ncbi:VOC family protein [Cupriavidus nantongensis]|uniref:Glyoxalase n=1 Tax=Cupriavidus nantongensis TaxID=1796606 RepID=A0A142JVH3_9BURK|nr:VOC family protein [Cupriavidus nantongensis]AMR82085.1 glyoxalase [Cupriavidus nantongensis]
MSVPNQHEPPLPGIGVPVHGLHHFAWRCRDAEETRHFYEDLLGLPLIHMVRADVVPSTGERCPYAHLFFEMQDGGCIAFFDLGDDQAALPSPNTPPWVNHLALRVASREDLLQACHRLRAAGVEVLGVTDHHFLESIYFFDPNGIRLELTTPAGDPDYARAARASAHRQCAEWVAEKARARQQRQAAQGPGSR